MNQSISPDLLACLRRTGCTLRVGFMPHERAYELTLRKDHKQISRLVSAKTVDYGRGDLIGFELGVMFQMMGQPNVTIDEDRTEMRDMMYRPKGI